MEARRDLLILGGLLSAAAIAAIAAGIGLIVQLLLRLWRGDEAFAGPPEPPRWGLLPALLLAAVVVGIQALSHLAGPPPDGREVTAGGLAFGVAFQVMIAGAALAVVRRAGQGLGALGLPGRTPAPRAFLQGLRFLLMAVPLVAGARVVTTLVERALGRETIQNPAAEILLETDALGMVVAVAAMAVIQAPLVEEIVFRGFFFGALRERFGRAPGVVVASAIFAFVHPPSDWLPIFFLGAAFALAYERTGSLVAPLAAHFANNAWGILTLFFLRAVSRA